MEWLSAAASEPYYLFHLLAFFSYLPIRCSAALVLSPAAAHLLLRREIQAVLAFLALAAVKVIISDIASDLIPDTAECAASKLTPLQLETVLNDGSTSRFWLVEFRSSSSTSCIRASRCFAELSITYSNKNLSFAIVDLGLFPIVAEKFGISLGNMAQLPTYILFENATEIARFPDIDLGVKISYPPITKGLLSRHFELDRLLLEYVNGK